MPNLFISGDALVDAVWVELEWQMHWLHARWTVYRELYGTNAEWVEVLNSAAGICSGVIQDAMLVDVQVTLSNMADPSKTKTRHGEVENLTFSSLEAGLRRTGLEISGLRDALLDFQQSCKRIKSRRNKWIGHFDLETMLNGRAELAHPARDEVEAALAKARDFMNAVEQAVMGSTTRYESNQAVADPRRLMDVLRSGLAARANRPFPAA